ncbi:MAG TPA: iron-containing alcohol dehydrogenase [Bryobacteraceae bacterium]|nr:iron-containing alcohol dehydrogenase [Bryobacteraceae bacterium]
MRFEFTTAGRIIFGPGTVAELGPLARAIGRRAFVVTGRDKIRHAGVINDLEGAGLNCTLFGVAGEPTVHLVHEGAALFAASGCELLIAIGGGSAIDAGKAIAALAANPGDPLQYLEVIGAGKAIPNTPFPMIAVPTTAGTGSEVTRNAVLASPQHRVKVSLRSPMMLPRVAIVDPQLTIGLPPAITASTGLDALTQLIEPYVSARANPMTDAFCLDGLRAVKRSLAAAYRNGSDAAARAGMSYASLLGGLSLANAGLGIVHGFAAPIGGMFDAPHGAVCAAILPYGMAANIRAGAALERYREIAAILTGSPQASAQDGVTWVYDHVRALSIPGLAKYGIGPAHVDDIVAKAAKASSMKANPIQLPAEELKRVLEEAI